MLTISTAYEQVYSEVICGKYNANLLKQICQLSQDDQLKIARNIINRAVDSGKSTQLSKFIQILIKNNEWTFFISFFTIAIELFRNDDVRNSISKAISSNNWNKFPIDVIEICLRLDVNQILLPALSFDTIKKLSKSGIEAIYSTTNSYYLYDLVLNSSNEPIVFPGLSLEETKQTVLTRVQYPVKLQLVSRILQFLEKFDLVTTKSMLMLFAATIENSKQYNSIRPWVDPGIFDNWFLIWEWFQANGQIEIFIKYLLLKHRESIALTEIIIAIVFSNKLQNEYFPKIFTEELLANKDFADVATAKQLLNRSDNILFTRSIYSSTKFPTLTTLINTLNNCNNKHELFLAPIKSIVVELLLTANFDIKERLLHFLARCQFDSNLN